MTLMLASLGVMMLIGVTVKEGPLRHLLVGAAVVLLTGSIWLVWD